MTETVNLTPGETPQPLVPPPFSGTLAVQTS